LLSEFIIKQGNEFWGIDKDESALQEARKNRVLRPNGILLITAYNMAPLTNHLRLFFGFYPNGLPQLKIAQNLKTI